MPSGSRRQAREAACQLLYQMDLRQDWKSGQATQFWKLLDAPPERDSRKYAETIVDGVTEYLTELDKTISTCAKNWAVERMAMIDRNILRAAAWELLYEQLPAGVAINEWLEIAKRYGGEETPSFINGILDRIAKSRPRD